MSSFTDGNIDTFWLAADGNDAAFVTADGQIWASQDAGKPWSEAGQIAGRPRALALV